MKVEAAMWTFITTEGIEPTNNAAERALRPIKLKCFSKGFKCLDLVLERLF
ncbi:transposase [Phormidium tenue FACHB-886]|nr:transposase [Phormidium tenue FACHB-886]